MKKLLFFISLFIFFIVPVKADTTILNIQYGGSDYPELYYLDNLLYNDVIIDKIDIQSEVTESISCNSRSDCYNKALSYYQSSNYQYYTITLSFYPQNNKIDMHLHLFNFSSNDYYYQHVYSGGTRYRFYYSNNQSIATGYYYLTIMDGWSDPNANSFYEVYDYNFNFVPDGDYAFSGFFSNENENINNMIKILTGEPIPKIKDLLQYNSWSEYENNHLEGYAEVNLDNYDYVLLTLKDYTQINAFQTNFQVKGQIGITPIYNYGQTSKDSITGAQVQDRCNVNYSNYTAYPFYILQTDLQNNVIYAVKECESASSFKYDTSIFDITYVTAQNIDNPTVTINGHTYNVIPYDDLPSTATKNEEDNYIPGESYNFVDAGIDSLSTAIKSLQQGLSNLWNTFTYFTSFVGLIFSSLPVELRTILLSAFVVAITIGLIKLFTN